jgi:hypothetical protein
MDESIVGGQVGGGWARRAGTLRWLGPSGGRAPAAARCLMAPCPALPPQLDLLAEPQLGQQAPAAHAIQRRALLLKLPVGSDHFRGEGPGAGLHAGPCHTGARVQRVAQRCFRGCRCCSEFAPWAHKAGARWPPADEIPGLVGDQQGRPCLVVLPSDRPASRREALEVEALLAQLLQEPAGAAARWGQALRTARRRIHAACRPRGPAQRRPAPTPQPPGPSHCCRACQWRAAALATYSADALATIITSLAARGSYSHTWQFRSTPSPQQLLPLPGEAGYGALGSGAGLAALSGLLQAKGRPGTAMQAHYESSRGAAAAGSGRAPSPPRQRPGSPGLLGGWRAAPGAVAVLLPLLLLLLLLSVCLSAAAGTERQPHAQPRGCTSPLHSQVPPAPGRPPAPSRAGSTR